VVSSVVHDNAFAGFQNQTWELRSFFILIAGQVPLPNFYPLYSALEYMQILPGKPQNLHGLLDEARMVTLRQKYTTGKYF
jgi:hypothetical protein